MSVWCSVDAVDVASVVSMCSVVCEAAVVYGLTVDMDDVVVGPVATGHGSSGGCESGPLLDSDSAPAHDGVSVVCESWGCWLSDGVCPTVKSV